MGPYSNRISVLAERYTRAHSLSLSHNLPSILPFSLLLPPPHCPGYSKEKPCDPNVGVCKPRRDTRSRINQHLDLALELPVSRNCEKITFWGLRPSV